MNINEKIFKVHGENLVNCKRNYSPLFDELLLITEPPTMNFTHGGKPQTRQM